MSDETEETRKRVEEQVARGPGWWEDKPPSPRPLRREDEPPGAGISFHPGIHGDPSRRRRKPKNGQLDLF